MKTWRSYDGTVTLSWLCVVFFVAALREASLSDDASIVQLAYGVMVAAVAVAVLAIYLGMRMKRRVEDKVRTSDVILTGGHPGAGEIELGADRGCHSPALRPDGTGKQPRRVGRGSRPHRKRARRKRLAAGS